jgi:hypothetical protein
MLHRLRTLVLALLILTPFAALAQTPPPQAPASSEQLLKPEELDALVAGIALYPDTLLSLVLMASTYPLEVVQADRWAKENKNLKGDELKAAADKQPWDDSVKSLVATPDVLSMMSTKLDWTQKLGDAVLAQQPDVMDAVQRLRTKAEANNKLTSTKEQKVTKRLSLSNQRSPTRSTCHIMIPPLSTEGGRTQPIRHIISRRPDTSRVESSRAESHLAPATRSGAGHLAEIIGAGGAIGAETTSQ